MAERFIEDIEYIEVTDFKGIQEVKGNRWRVHSHRDEGKKRIYLLERIHYGKGRAPGFHPEMR
jgi:hypothetical protein